MYHLVHYNDYLRSELHCPCINANLRMYKNDYLKMYSFDKLMDNILEVKEYYAYANQC
ncbi:hypothetical protein [Sutcliffiella cohnii]|uniref:hypothetical protein n=1 Tax=Sutcliffiella cohnii TaxID=33932 RepID=UPI000A4F8F65|nr:hypothetical protein [Sutcliffiella cohnii]